MSIKFKYYMNPNTWATDPTLNAFETDEQRDTWAPEATKEVIAVPDDYSILKYDYDFSTDTWVKKVEWEKENAIEEALEILETNLNLARKQFIHHLIMKNIKKSKEWQNYYISVYDVQKDPAWPYIEIWPKQPEE